MKDYLVGLDVWEGSLDIDEQELQDGGVAFLIVRLNSIDGSTHMDENFHRQWAQAERFYRWPYFVYNPWLTGPENCEWMGDHLPPGVRRVAIDIEVKRKDYPASVYASEVQAFTTRAKKFWKPVIYTGGWFLPLLSSWPADVDYWWGRYPYLLCPEKSENITWQELRRRLDSLAWDPCPAASGIETPGPVVVWQCSGDRLKLPGCVGRAVDVNLTLMSVPQLAAWVGDGPAAVRWEYALTEWARRQATPYTGPDPDRMI